MIDFDHHLLPDQLHYPRLGRILLSLFATPARCWHPTHAAASSAVSPVIAVERVLAIQAPHRKEGMGYGDFKTTGGVRDLAAGNRC
jgi:prepilin signal peptidase PulO-like enzyme (type II secretory pathway)